MTLTADIFKEIVEMIRTEKKTELESRDSQGRFCIDGTATIIPCGSAPDRGPILVNVVDLSAVAIAFRYKTALKSGTQFILFLPPRAGKSRGLLCRVARWQPVGEGLFEINAAFEQGVVAPFRSDALAQIKGLEARLRMAS